MSKRPKKQPLRIPTVLILVVLAAGAAWAVLRPEEVVRYDGPVWTVERRSLTIAVSESGTLEAREKRVLKCEVDERSTTITHIIPEGTRVQEGDLLVELDSSVLQDELYDEEIDVLDTEAEYLAVKENLEVVKNQAQADQQQAELDLRFAREDLEKYIKGDYPKQLMEAENAVTLAREELRQAEEDLNWSQKLYDKQFLSRSEVDQDSLAKNRREVDLTVALAEVDLLKQYSHARQLAQLEADVDLAVLALDRIRRKNRADLVQAEANLRARELQLERQRNQLTEIVDQVKACKIYAPVAGMAVYATTGDDRRGDDQPLEVGREVWDQMELIHIPIDDAMLARIKVHESSLDQVEPGLPVRLTVEALQGVVLRGTVARIAPLPDAQSRWLNPDLKVYDTVIDIEGEVSRLRTGMTCRAEILIDELEDVLYVPVHAVVRVNGKPTVWVVDEEGQLLPRTVVLGLDDNRRVHVVEGLAAGEIVALAPPLQQGDVEGKRPSAEQASEQDSEEPGGSPVDPSTP